MREKKYNRISVFKPLLLSVLSVILACPIVYANSIKLINSASFEPIRINNTVDIETSARQGEMYKNPSLKNIPIPKSTEKDLKDNAQSEEKTIDKNYSNDFFAPIDDNSTNKLTSPPVNPSLESFDVFKDIDEKLCPSEFSKKTRENKLTEIISDDTNSFTDAEQKETEGFAKYYATAEEDYSDTTDYSGKIISEVKFQGLKTLDKSLPESIIKTKKDSIFQADIIQQDLQKIYNIGYFTEDIFVEPALNDDGTVTLTFILEENIKVKNAQIAGNKAISTQELTGIIKDLENLPQNLSLINEAIDNINKYYYDKGFILARVINVNDDSDGNLTFEISEGTIEKIKIEGNKKTKDYIIQRNILTRTGSVYNENIFKQDLSKIYDTQIFDEVNRDFKENPDKKGYYTLIVQVKEATSNNISVGVGLDNVIGGFGSIGYNEKNLFGKNQKLSLTGLLGTGLLLSDASITNRMNYQIELGHFEPYFLNETNTLSSRLFYRDLGSYQVPLAIERRVGFSSKIEHKVRDYDNLSTSFALGIEHIHLSEGDFNKISSLYDKYHINIGRRNEQLRGGTFFNLAPGVKYSTLDNETMPREGLIAKMNFMEAIGISNINHTNGRLIGAITRYIPIAKKSTLSIGAKAGIKIHGDEMPEVMAFRLGGPYTIRGFRMNGVGTGDSFLMGSVELQTPVPLMDRLRFDVLKNLRFAFFVDAGKIFDPTITSTLYDRPLSAISAGVGLRVHLPGMAPISIDYGIPLTNTGDYGPSGGYFTFGTSGLYDSY